jgi:hypothetical protein
VATIPEFVSIVRRTVVMVNRRKQMKVVFVVHPYGHMDQDRDPEELKGTGQYLQRCAEILVKHQNCIKEFIIPGGMMHNGVVEAESVARYMRLCTIFPQNERMVQGLPCRDLSATIDPVPKSTISIVESAVLRMK